MTVNLLIALAGLIILSLALAPSSAPGCAAVSPPDLRQLPVFRQIPGRPVLRPPGHLAPGD